MSQLSEYRRKVLKKSQQALSAELGYEKWQTYAAQEQGKNPLPEDVKVKLEKKFKYKGPWPDQEAQDAPTAGAGTYVTREDVAELRGRLEGRIEVLERAFEKLGEVVRDLVRESEEARLRGPKA